MGTILQVGWKAVILSPAQTGQPASMSLKNSNHSGDGAIILDATRPAFIPTNGDPLTGTTTAKAAYTVFLI
jgi:hypothetical protein